MRSAKAPPGSHFDIYEIPNIFGCYKHLMQCNYNIAQLSSMKHQLHLRDQREPPEAKTVSSFGLLDLAFSIF